MASDSFSGFVGYEAILINDSEVKEFFYILINIM
ncbi:hypothetical protein LMG8286_01617 [Campylobacter suis]|uniref:Uncharacterized protein n=1 Tax=Campylobacter suis TaxID=2790657 RepID=A0ABM8Q7W2_9BACT|nr:hypothetical protein LMG8286_01617 [Campylobacter suis]